MKDVCADGQCPFASITRIASFWTAVLEDPDSAATSQIAPAD
jgi:hypothetical protein